MTLNIQFESLSEVNGNFYCTISFFIEGVCSVSSESAMDAKQVCCFLGEWDKLASKSTTP